MCTRYLITNRVSELKVHIELTRFVQPEKIEIDANERAVNEKSPYCFFVCTTFDSFLNDLSVSHYTQYNSISQNVQSKKVCKIFIFSWHTSYCSISLFVFSQTNVPQGCPVRRFLTGRRVDWASGRLRSIFYSTTYLTFGSLRPSYFSCANSLSRNSDTSSMSSLSIKSSFINTSRSV